MFERFDEFFRSWPARRRAALRQTPASGARRPSEAEGLVRAALQRRAVGPSTIRAATWRARIEKDVGKSATTFLKEHDDSALASLCSPTSVAIAWRRSTQVVRRRPGRCPDPVHRLDHQGLRPAVRRPQGQSRGPDEPDADDRVARGHGRCRGPRGSRSKASATMRGPASRRCSKRVPSLATSGHARSARFPSQRSSAPAGEEQSTQAAFGQILLDLSKAGGDFKDRIVTTSPDVTVSTNSELG